MEMDPDLATEMDRDQITGIDPGTRTIETDQD